MAPLTKEQIAEILKILTKEQFDTWQALLGKRMYGTLTDEENNELDAIAEIFTKKS